MKNPRLIKKSLRIAGHKTSLAMEAEFWDGLEKWAAWEGKSRPVLLAEIKRKLKPGESLVSAVRTAVLTSK